MPGTTPNRGYPFPLDPDPLNVAGDIESLARAIDLDFGNIVQPEALDIENWAADGSWGALTHPQMGGTEYMIMSQPTQPTLISAFAGQGVSIRFGGNDVTRHLDIASNGFNFFGNNVNLQTANAFTVPAGTGASFSSGSGGAFYRPQDGSNNTIIQNSTGGHIYYQAWAHHFRFMDGTGETMVVHPTGGVDVIGALSVTESVSFPTGAGFYSNQGGWVATLGNAGIRMGHADIHSNGTGAWNTQQLVIQADAGNAGLSLAVHQASWAVIVRANPGQTWAPCVDIMTSDTAAYANLYCGILISEQQVNVSSERFKDNVQPVTDEDLLARVVQLSAVTWEAPADTPPSAVTATPNIGVTAEALIVPFPEMVTLDEQGRPEAVIVSQIASTALAAVGALTRRVDELAAQINGQAA